MDNNVFIHLKLSANLHQRDTEPEPTNYRTHNSSKQRGWFVSSRHKTGPLVNLFHNFKRDTTVPLHFFFSHGTKSRHMVCLSSL